MTLIKCEYCGQRQEDIGVCKYCGASLPENDSQIYNHRDSYRQFVTYITKANNVPYFIDDGGLGDWKSLSNYYKEYEEITKTNENIFSCDMKGDFTCPICGKKQEIKILHGQSFSCKHCGKSFISYGNSLEKYGSGWSFLDRLFAGKAFKK